MNIENVERYLQELEAIKNYSQIKGDYEKLSREVNDLKIKLAAALKEALTLKSSKAKLNGADMTLEEARVDFIRAEDAEVEKRAAGRFEKLKADYETRMPQLVYQRLCDTLKQPRLPEDIAKLICAEANKKADAVLCDRNVWPEWFKKLYEEEVQKRVSSMLNQEFSNRVEESAMVRAQQRLTELIDREWPAWFQTNVDPRIKELESKIFARAFDLLRGPWILTCDRCATTFNTELTPEGVEQMLKTGQIKVMCSNPGCEDKGWFSTGRHSFFVSLYSLISYYLNQ
jgi:hypothetical protein